MPKMNGASRRELKKRSRKSLDVNTFILNRSINLELKARELENYNN